MQWNLHLLPNRLILTSVCHPLTAKVYAHSSLGQKLPSPPPSQETGHNYCMFRKPTAGTPCLVVGRDGGPVVPSFFCECIRPREAPLHSRGHTHPLHTPNRKDWFGLEALSHCSYGHAPDSACASRGRLCPGGRLCSRRKKESCKCRSARCHHLVLSGHTTTRTADERLPRMCCCRPSTVKNTKWTTTGAMATR
jgi:hypothetical protein